MSDQSLATRLFGWSLSALSPLGRPERKSNKEKTGRPSRVTIIHPTVDIHSKWTVAQVESSITRHEEGDFYDSAKLWEAMGRDDRIAGVMLSRLNALISRSGARFTIQEGDNGNDKFIEGVEAWWWKSLPEGTQRPLLSDMVGMGFALGRVPYKTNQKTWTPELVTHWPLHSVTYDETRRMFSTNTEASGTIFIEPDDPNWLIITPGGERSWMGGAVRALGLLFAMRQFNWRDWARFNERHGMPLIAIKEPPISDSKDKDAFWKGIRRMGSTGVVRLPKSGNKDDDADFEIEFIEAKDDAHESFKDFKDSANVAIAVLLLGQNLSTEVSGGSFAAATAHGRVRQDITDGDAETFSTCLKTQIIVPWGTLNFEGFVPEDAPNPTWDTGFAGDKQLTAETFKTAAEGTEIFQALGMPIDFEAFFEKLGIPLLDGEEIQIQVARLPNGAPQATGGSFMAQTASGKTIRFDVRDDGTVVMQGKDVDSGDMWSDEIVDEHLHQPDGGKLDRVATVASGIAAQDAGGFIEGQAYADALTEHGVRNQAAQFRGPDNIVDKLIIAIDTGSTYDEIRDLVRTTYDEFIEPEEMAKIVEALWIMAHRAGQTAVDQDV